MSLSTLIKKTIISYHTIPAMYSDGSILKPNEENPAKATCSSEKQKEMTHMCIHLEMVGYGNTKKIGPFKLPMVILLHFRVSQYKCKTKYCEKKE
jgi:hypothetical protein